MENPFLCMHLGSWDKGKLRPPPRAASVRSESEIDWTDFPETSEVVEDEGLWQQLLGSTQAYLARHRVISEFLVAVKAGKTNDVLKMLAQHPQLLAHHRFVSEGDTVWHLLAEFGDVGQLQLLVNFVKIHGDQKAMPDGKKMTRALGPHVTRGSGDGVGQQRHYHESVRTLVNMGNSLYQTPLMFAAYHGRDDVVALLLNQGADPWAVDRCGQRCALHYACQKGHTPCVRALLDNLDPIDRVRHGIRYVDVRTASGISGAHLAIAACSVSSIVALLAWDARIDAVNGFEAPEFWIYCAKETTPLHLCALVGNDMCAKAILQYYVRKRTELALVDPRLWLDGENRTPQQLAIVRGWFEMEDMLDPETDADQIWSNAEIAAFAQYGSVPKLKQLAAVVIKASLEGSILESEEYMKLLGTFQNQGRLFARVANVAYSQTSKTDNGYGSIENDYTQYMTMNASKHTQNGRMESVLGNKPQHRSSFVDPGPGSNLNRAASSAASGLATTSYGGPFNNLQQQQQSMHPDASGRLNPGSPSCHFMQPSTSPQTEDSKASQQMQEQQEPLRKEPAFQWLGYQRGWETGTRTPSISEDPTSSKHFTGGSPKPVSRGKGFAQKWLGYERSLGNATAAPGPSPLSVQTLEKGRSKLSESAKYGAVSWYQGVLGLFGLARDVYVPPVIGIEMCGLCHDNQPHLQMMPCRHRLCLVCAKKLCCELDLHRVPQCPYCRSLVHSFDMS